ncbi:hypothetical protein [Neptuniibacter sp. QD37_11]|uniref:hypothetical protein n=1 Tax=Neptuniibacter sp. QD37_11 TaxID=3398209 RepID=UPI0039F53258
MPYFADENGAIYHITADGAHNYPTTLASVLVKDGVVTLVNKEGQATADYKLWQSLTALAASIEPEGDGSVSLDDAVAELHTEIERFKAYWIKNNELTPEDFPLRFPADNAGAWAEQFLFFFDSDDE